jgi:hypothetical protein
MFHPENTFSPAVPPINGFDLLSPVKKSLHSQENT